MKHFLETDSILLEFNGRKILSDIYVKCETGKITGLLGRNGTGKSCLMQIIFGSMKCDKSVRIDKLSQHKISKFKSEIRYLPQFNFIPKSLSLKRVFLDYELDFLFFKPCFRNLKIDMTKK